MPQLIPASNRLRPIVLGALSALTTLTGCAGLLPATDPRVDPSTLPESIRVPAGHVQSLYTTGVGEITYECREKKGGGHEWAFVAPLATLSNARGEGIGKYFAGPTWQLNDGSQVSGKQVAVSPAPAGNIPLQLVQVPTAPSAGLLKGVSHIQRLKTVGGVAPAMPCGLAQVGHKQTVPYRADYVFYRPIR